MKLLSALAVTPIVLAAALVADTPLQKNGKVLQKAESLSVKYRLAQIGGATQEEVLLMSKPNLFRIEVPGKLVVCDGKMITTYTKATNTYVQVAAEMPAMKELFKSPDLWAWSAFFDADYMNGATNEKKGKSVSVRGVNLTEASIIRDSALTTYLVDDATGVVRGASYKTSDGKEFVLQATEITVGTEKLADSKFQWVAPEGAKLATEVPQMQALVYSDIKTILDKNCTRCHGGANPRDGIDLSSYDNIMASGTVVAGNADGSKMIRVLRRGAMPPGGRLAGDSIDQLAKWINDGAKP